MICGHAQIVGLAPSLGAPSMTSYSLGLPALWPDDSIGMDTPSPGSSGRVCGTANLPLLPRTLRTNPIERPLARPAVGFVRVSQAAVAGS